MQSNKYTATYLPKWMPQYLEALLNVVAVKDQRHHRNKILLLGALISQIQRKQTNPKRETNKLIVSLCSYKLQMLQNWTKGLWRGHPTTHSVTEGVVERRMCFKYQNWSFVSIKISSWLVQLSINIQTLAHRLCARKWNGKGNHD